MDLSDKYDLNKLYESESDQWEQSSKKDFTEGSLTKGRYENLELIAEGGMKQIFKAYDSNNCRSIALAKLRSDVPEEQCEDFLREAYLTASLEHPNIISLYDIDFDENCNPVFTMELKVGDALSQIIKKRAAGDEKYIDDFPLRKRMEIFLNVCNAISYAHSVGVLHLDIKPGNIQVGKHGEVQVCDWGLGKKTEEANQSRKENLVQGTPGYMAPEQIDHTIEIDERTDIYALGALLYTLLTDKIPMDGSINTIIEKTIIGDLVDPTEKNPDMEVSESLSAVVRKAMSTEKELRYQKVEELTREVEKYLSGRSTSAENASFMKELKLFYMRNKSICQVISAALLIIIISTSFFITKINKTNTELKVSNEETKKALEQSRENYKLYKEKSDAEKKLLSDLVQSQFKKEIANFQGIKFYLHKPKYIGKAVDEILTFYQSSNEKVKSMDLLILLFITQKFDQIDSERNLELKELSAKFSQYRKGRNNLLTAQDFLALLKELSSQKTSIQKIMEPMIHYQLTLTRVQLNKVDFIKELIKSFNPRWTDANFIYNEEDFSLTLKGKDLKRLSDGGRYSSGLSFLRYLKTDRIILEDTSISSFTELEEVEVRSLDIRGSNIQGTRSFEKIKGLRELIIRKDQFKDSGPKSFPDWVKVTYK